MQEHRGDQLADRSSVPAFWLIAAAAAVLLCVILVTHNWSVLHTEILPSGDAAADMLLVDRANHDWLLTGHYSRFDFNHPGPFFLYLRHLSERLVGNDLPGPYNAHLLAVFGGVALFVGMGAAAASTLAGGGWPGMAAALATLTVVLIQGQRGEILTNAWMPNVLVTPFFAFSLLLAETARGRLRLLPAATFCGGALAHGYVLLLPIVGVAWPLAALLGVRRYRQRDAVGRALPVWPIAASVALILLFAVPPLLDALLHPPGNVARIIAVARRSPPGDVRSWSSALAFVAQYWADLNPLIAVAAALGALLALRERGSRMGLGYVAFIVALLTVLMMVIVKRAPGELYPFIGLFYLGAPLALTVAAVASGLPSVMRGAIAARCVSIALALLLAGTALLGDFSGSYSGDPSLRPMTEAILRDARAPHEQRIRLQFADHEHWAVAAGLLVDLARFGQPACVVAPGWDVLFTPERICPPLANARQHDIVAAEACGDGCIVRSGKVGIQVIPEK